MSEPSIEDLIEIELCGAQAHLEGRGVINNPYLKPDAMPDHTGEDPVFWGLKMQAWATGWRKAESKGALQQGRPHSPHHLHQTKV